RLRGGPHHGRLDVDAGGPQVRAGPRDLKEQRSRSRPDVQDVAVRGCEARDVAGDAPVEARPAPGPGTLRVAVGVLAGEPAGLGQVIGPTRTRGVPNTRPVRRVGGLTVSVPVVRAADLVVHTITVTVPGAVDEAVDDAVDERHGEPPPGDGPPPWHLRST